MKVSQISLKQCLASGGWLMAVLLFGGCKSVDYADPNPAHPYAFPTQGVQPPPLVNQSPVPAAATAPVTSPPAATTSITAVPLAPTPAAPIPAVPIPPAPMPGVQTNGTSGMLRVGDTVTVNFTDLPPPYIPESKIRIAEDGNITLPFNISVHAAGKTARQLEQEIRSEYVPKYFNYMTVTVKTEERFYFVGGEVKVSNRQLYFGEMTVLRAIDTAGGFTDFANRKKIELRRANGQKFTINWYKAIQDSNLDLPVYPNDQIIVHKRWL